MEVDCLSPQRCGVSRHKVGLGPAARCGAGATPDALAPKPSAAVMPPPPPAAVVVERSDGVYIEEADGHVSELFPGVLDEDCEWVYRNGQCLSLAVALSAHLNAPVVVHTFTDGLDGWPPEPYENLRHAYVRVGEDWVDVMGRSDPSAVRLGPGERLMEFSAEQVAEGEAMATFEGYLCNQDVAFAQTMVEAVCRRADLA